MDDLDVTIKHIRSAIFGLSTAGRAVDGLAERVTSLSRDAATVLGFEPRLYVDGPIDTGLDEAVGADLLAVLREALTNVARHAAATGVDIAVSVGDDVILTVADDGFGPPTAAPTGGRGLANMTVRARRHMGSFRLEASDSGGTMAVWRVPRDQSSSSG